MLGHTCSKPLAKRNQVSQSFLLSSKYMLAVYSVRWRHNGATIHNSLKNCFSASPKTSAEVSLDTLK